jgi:hypothetical protein
MAFSLKRGRSGDAAERDYYKKTFSPGDPCADPCCIRWTKIGASKNGGPVVTPRSSGSSVPSDRNRWRLWPTCPDPPVDSACITKFPLARSRKRAGGEDRGS